MIVITYSIDYASVIDFASGRLGITRINPTCTPLLPLSLTQSQRIVIAGIRYVAVSSVDRSLWLKLFYYLVESW